MRNKVKDTLYCGVSEYRISHASPKIDMENLQHLRNFIARRYKIRLRKDVLGKPAPWTKDPVLQRFKFTNVRREHDRVTRELIQQVSHNDMLGLLDKVYNTFLFRAWNNPDTFRDLGGPWEWQAIEGIDLKERVRPLYHKLQLENPDRKWWSAAYNQGGTKYAWKFPDGEGFGRAKKEVDAQKYPDWERDIPLRVFHLGPWLEKLGIFPRIMEADDQQTVFNIIQELRGFKTFLAYQVFVDLTYIEEFPFSENEFTVAGPGCRKGIDLVFKDKDGMSYEECIFWLRDNAHLLQLDFRDLFHDLPEYDQCINVMSLENCFCELSKYIRTVNGTGRPKVRYPGEGVQ